MKVLVSGDFYDGYRISENVKSDNTYAPFSGIEDIIWGTDYRFLNFEFPVECSNSKPIDKAGPNLKGHLDSIKLIKDAGFNVCTLANNHILDQGEESCLKTKFELEVNGFYTVGAGENLKDAASILFLHKDGETLAVINCCEYEFSIASENSAGANPINPIQQYYKIKEARKHANYVMVIVHGGHEHYQLPSPRMKELYRFFVDAGADAVVNHHQHCFCGYEVYNNKPIFYGLGNLLFDNPSCRYSNWNEGFLVVISFHREKSPSFVIHPYSQCNDVASVELQKQKSYDNFIERINKLNDIINCDSLLKKKHNEWMEEHSKDFPIVLQPYIHPLFIALYARKLMPVFMNKWKKYHVLGMLTCESHLERLIHMVSLIKVKK